MRHQGVLEFSKGPSGGLGTQVGLPSVIEHRYLLGPFVRRLESHQPGQPGFFVCRPGLVRYQGEAASRML